MTRLRSAGLIHPVLTYERGSQKQILLRRVRKFLKEADAKQKKTRRTGGAPT